MASAPMVSVIMPAYNSAAFISEAIGSVIKQTYGNWELIVIDDASGDATPEIVEDFSNQDKRIKIIKNILNQGPGPSRNSGMKTAKGDFIAFLDSDDLWLPKKLEIQLKFMQKHDLVMSFSSYLLMDEKGRRIPKFVEALPLLTYDKLLRSNYVGNLTAIYNVHKIGKIFAPGMRKRQDWALWLKILQKSGPTRGILEPLAIYRIRKESLSRNKYALIIHNYKIYREYLNFGIFKSNYFMGRFLWEHFMVKSRQEKSLDKRGELL